MFQDKSGIFEDFGFKFVVELMNESMNAGITVS